MLAQISNQGQLEVHTLHLAIVFLWSLAVSCTTSIFAPLSTDFFQWPGSCTVNVPPSDPMDFLVVCVSVSFVFCVSCELELIAEGLMGLWWKFWRTSGWTMLAALFWSPAGTTYARLLQHQCKLGQSIKKVPPCQMFLCMCVFPSDLSKEFVGKQFDFKQKSSSSKS